MSAAKSKKKLVVQIELPETMIADILAGTEFDLEAEDTFIEDIYYYHVVPAIEKQYDLEKKVIPKEKK